MYAVYLLAYLPVLLFKIGIIILVLLDKDLIKTSSVFLSVVVIEQKFLNTYYLNKICFTYAVLHYLCHYHKSCTYKHVLFLVKTRLLKIESHSLLTGMKIHLLLTLYETLFLSSYYICLVTRMNCVIILLKYK